MPPLVEDSLGEESSSASESGNDNSFTVVSTDNIISDGNRSRWPTEERFEIADPSTYLTKLATKWMQYSGKLEPGMLTHLQICLKCLQTACWFLLDSVVYTRVDISKMLLWMYLPTSLLFVGGFTTIS
jgi:hypothetical protein